jgi:hypothetical protein
MQKEQSTGASQSITSSQATLLDCETSSKKRKQTMSSSDEKSGNPGQGTSKDIWSLSPAKALTKLERLSQERATTKLEEVLKKRLLTTVEKKKIMKNLAKLQNQIEELEMTSKRLKHESTMVRVTMKSLKNTLAGGAFTEGHSKPTEHSSFHPARS